MGPPFSLLRRGGDPVRRWEVRPNGLEMSRPASPRLVLRESQTLGWPGRLHRVVGPLPSGNCGYFFCLVEGLGCSTAFQHSASVRPFPSAMLRRDFSIIARKRGERARTRLSRSSSSVGAIRTATALPFRVRSEEHTSEL